MTQCVPFQLSHMGGLFAHPADPTCLAGLGRPSCYGGYVGVVQSNLDTTLDLGQFNPAKQVGAAGWEISHPIWRGSRGTHIITTDEHPVGVHTSD